MINTFVVEAYLELITDMIDQIERDSLVMSGEKLEETLDGIITLKAHQVQAKQILQALKGSGL